LAVAQVLVIPLMVARAVLAVVQAGVVATTTVALVHQGKVTLVEAMELTVMQVLVVEHPLLVAMAQLVAQDLQHILLGVQQLQPVKM
jgi:hypothetical protein